jgi:DNA polymerase IV (DinB-like DNA polymerase)
MPVSQAYALCPHAVFLPPDFPLYARASADIMAFLRPHASRFQQVSIDEAYLDVSPVGSFDAARELAQRIRHGIRTMVDLSCSIGIAPTKVVAKIASDFTKPDGLTVVGPAQVKEFLAPLPVRKIPGIGRKTEAELLGLGIRTIGDLAASDVQLLIARFGRWGIAMREIASGIDRSRVEEREGAQSVSRETTFLQDTDDWQEILATMGALAADAHRILLDEGLRFRTITVKVRYEGFVTRTRARTLLHHTDEETAVRTNSCALLRDLFNGKKIRLVGLKLSSLEKGDAWQMSLYPADNPGMRC